MTTIAWDGTTLAGDTQGNAGGMRVKSEKIWRLPTRELFGASGDADAGIMVAEWIAGGPKPEFADHENDWPLCILIGCGGEIFRIEKNLKKFRLFDRFHAIGSGRDYAMAAMALGKSAREAVELAARFDVWTGGDVTELRLR